ncbi:MAG: DUF2207 domain-containing protein [Cyclobacteriaceae bacterium]|nr:DUF2207 domain-containing protein [Cyclobacteriaceae bacterium]
MRSKISILICVLLLSSVVLHAQDLVFTKPSSKFLSQEELRVLIREAAFAASSRNKVPRELFEAEYKNVEKQLWSEARTPIIQAFRWVDNANDIHLGGTRKEAYQQALSQAVFKVVLARQVFKKLVAFDQTDRIISFTSDVKVNNDGWLTVNEFIKIYNGSGEQSKAYLELYPGEHKVNNDIQRGLERTFPTNYVNEYGLQTKVPFEVMAVYKNEQPENFMVADYGNGALLRIGSAEKYLEDGVYEYKIQYRTTYQLKFHENKTELYWNVNGNGWVFTADSVRCTIIFPTGSEIFEHACYTGAQGSTTKNCTSKIINDSTIWFSTKQRLQSYEGLTVAAAIQPGIVSQPSYAALSIQLLKYNWALAVIALVMFTMFIINLINWIRFGRDPKQGVIVPGFEPPVNSPAVAGFIYNQKFKTEQFSAALVDLAVKKAITIQVKKEGSLLKKNTYLFKKGSAAASIKTYAKTAYNWNLENLYDLKADGSYNRMFESLHSNLQQHLTAKYQTDGSGRNKTQGFFARNSGAATWGFTAWFITLIFAFVTIAPIATETLSISAAVLLSVGFIAQFIFYKIMPAYNAQGRKLLDELLGFRMYLATAEEKRFDKLNPPEKNLELFERFLPYAVALDCQNEWANKFEDILKKAIADKSYQPSYFNSSDMNDGFSFSSISNSFSSNLSSTIASSSSAPSDSSDSGGSDGGGSSGGGGGGGGGGGW